MPKYLAAKNTEFKQKIVSLHVFSEKDVEKRH